MYNNINQFEVIKIKLDISHSYMMYCRSYSFHQWPVASRFEHLWPPGTSRSSLCPSTVPLHPVHLMGPPLVQRLLCIGSRVVHLEKDCLSFEEKDQDFFLLDLTANSRKMGPFLEALELRPFTWWKTHSHEVPLMVEIRERIYYGKPKRQKGSKTARQPACASEVLALQIRGQEFLVRNSSKELALVLKPGEETEALQQFVNELHKDIVEKKGSPSSSSQDIKELDSDAESTLEWGEDKQEGIAAEISALLEEVTNLGLKELRAHPKCHWAIWTASRGSFQICNKTEGNLKSTKKEITVKSLKRKINDARKMEAPYCRTKMDLVKLAVQQAVSLAMEYLDSLQDLPLQQAIQDQPADTEGPHMEGLNDGPSATNDISSTL